MKKLSLLIIMMATWMVASCGTTDGTKVGPEIGYYENRKESKGDSLIFSATSVWHCIVADKPWLDKDCDQDKKGQYNKHFLYCFLVRLNYLSFLFYGLHVKLLWQAGPCFLIIKIDELVRV